MPDKRTEHRQKSGKVAYEVVAYRYSDEQSIMLVGEAEIMVETFGNEHDPADLGTNLYEIRVDLLTAFDPEGRDRFAEVMADPKLRQAVESAAMDHYLLPPQVPVGLPKTVVEWGNVREL